MSKPKVIKDYDKLPEKVLEQLKIVYPYGFSQHLVSYVDRQGEKKLALPFETDDYYYLIRMSVVMAESIIEDDDDYDMNGVLKASIKKQYISNHEDSNIMEYNANMDNDFENLSDDDSDSMGDDEDDDY